MDIKRSVRNVDGLLADVTYIFNEKGNVDWRKMIRPEFLVVNTQRFEKKGVEIPTSTEGLDDRDLLILLAGIKDLARLRGYESVSHSVSAPTPEYVVSTCSISWIPNFETEGRSVTFSAIGDAGLVNTNGFGRLYLGAIAENRAFVRAVRNFLNINIAGQDEIAPKTAADDSNESLGLASPTVLLSKIMVEKNVGLDVIFAKLIEEKIDGAADFKTIDDIPKTTVFSLIERLKKKK